MLSVSAPVFASTPKPTRTPDAQQKAAILHRGGPARVMAGAGTGKSTTMCLRVRGLVAEGVPARTIVAMTFTRKGAEELRNKLVEICGEATAAKTTVGTFHRLATQEVLAYKPALPDPATQERGRWHVLDEDDASDLWHQACEEAAAERLPRLFNDEVFTGEKKPNKELEKKIRSLWSPLYEIRSYQRNMNQGSAAFGAFASLRLAGRSSAFRQLRSHPAKPKLDEFFDRVLRLYEGLKDLHNGKDYDDLLVLWCDLLRNDPAYRAALHERWQHVIVDEFQDTCLLQDEIISLLNTKNLITVGDIAQCIYSWRSAIPRLMMEFRDRYNAADYPLEFNYRSRSEILAVANSVLKVHHDMLARSQTAAVGTLPLLTLRGTRGAGGTVNFIAGASAYNETDLIAPRIERLLRDGAAPGEICVLSRISHYTRLLEARLRGFMLGGRPVPIQVWGGQSLLDTKTAKDLLAVLKCAARPADPHPYTRLAMLTPGIGEGAAADAYFRHVFSLAPTAQLRPLHEALQGIVFAQQRSDIPGTTRLTQGVAYAAEFLQRAYATDTRLDDDDKRRRKGECDALTQGMTEAIQRLAAEGDETSVSGLAGLITLYSLDPKRDRVVENAVTLSTVHQAKGLEWKHVFVMGCNEGTLPVLRKRSEDEGPADPATEAAELEEECRILYVALTRARDHLTVSYDHNRGLSRFLESVPSIREACARSAATIPAHLMERHKTRSSPRRPKAHAVV